MAGNRTRKLPQIQFAQEPEIEEIPDKKDCLEEHFEAMLDTDQSTRIQYWVWLARGQIAHFCLDLHLRRAGVWELVYRADTAHDSVHDHEYSPGKPRNTQTHCPITSLAEVDEWFCKLYDDLYNKWESKVKRWR